MDQEVNLADVLAIMREQIGHLSQENAILKATINKLTGDKLENTES